MLVGKIMDLKHEPEKMLLAEVTAKTLDKLYPIKAIVVLANSITDRNEVSVVREKAAQALEVLGVKPSADILADLSAKLNRI